MTTTKLPPLPKSPKRLELIQATIDADLLARARAKRLKDKISWRDLIEWALKAYLGQSG